jgi:hypothetical protein
LSLKYTTSSCNREQVVRGYRADVCGTKGVKRAIDEWICRECCVGRKTSRSLNQRGTCPNCSVLPCWGNSPGSRVRKRDCGVLAPPLTTVKGSALEARKLRQRRKGGRLVLLLRDTHLYEWRGWRWWKRRGGGRCDGEQSARSRRLVPAHEVQSSRLLGG